MHNLSQQSTTLFLDPPQQGSTCSCHQFRFPNLMANSKQGSFFDLFNSLVHSVPSLSDVQKMHYLSSCVEGEAEFLIRSFKVTGSNYMEAWGHFKRAILINDQLFIFPSGNIETSSSLRHLLDSFSEVVRALTALEQSVGQWVVLLLHILVSQLDPKTKPAWEMSLVNDDIPTFAQLSSFIKRRCRCRSLDAAGQISTSNSSSSGSQSFSTRFQNSINPHQ